MGGEIEQLRLKDKQIQAQLEDIELTLESLRETRDQLRGRRKSIAKTIERLNGKHTKSYSVTDPLYLAEPIAELVEKWVEVFNAEHGDTSAVLILSERSKVDQKTITAVIKRTRKFMRMATLEKLLHGIDAEWMTGQFEPAFPSRQDVEIPDPPPSQYFEE